MDSSIPTDTNAQNRRGVRFAVVLGAILIIGGVVVVSYSDYVKEFFTNTPSSPEGTLYVTLAAPDSSKTNLYAYNVKTKELGTFFVQNAITKLTSHISPDGQKMAYMQSAELMLPGSKTPHDILQLFVADMATKQTTQVTSSETLAKRNPDWSPDGTNILFTARDLSIKDTSSVPEDWGVYTTDLSGKESLIVKGSYPKWSPDGTKLLFFRNDGLYLYDVSQSGEEALTKVWGGDVFLSMKLALNHSRDVVVWTNPTGKEAFFFSIDWAGKKVQFIKSLETYALWAAFSPDDRYVAFQEVETWGENPTNPSLVAYRWEDKIPARIEIVDLSQFNQLAMFLTDWR